MAPPRRDAAGVGRARADPRGGDGARSARLRVPDRRTVFRRVAVPGVRAALAPFETLDAAEVARRGVAGRGRTRGEARCARLSTVALVGARRAGLAFAIRAGSAGLAHRVFGDVDAVPGPPDRHSWRWPRPRFLAPRVGARAVRVLNRQDSLRPRLDAHWPRPLRGQEDEQVARQPGAGRRGPGA